MKDPNLRATTVLSLVVHLSFLLIALIFIKQTNHLVVPSKYIVSLVGPEAEKGTVSVPQGYSLKPEKAAQLPEETEQYISDRIAVLKAKKKAERIVRLRSIISMKDTDHPKGTTEDKSKKEIKGTIPNEDYYIEKIGMEIRQHWSFPWSVDKNLMAIVSVTVMKNGTIRINRIEKNSGNPLFDRSVLKAISKASPVSSPPYEMEIGLRFTP